MLNNFANDNAILVADLIKLPTDSYTFVSNWGTTSWIDHCLCTKDAMEKIPDMNVEYKHISSDHKPVSIKIDIKDCIKVNNDKEDNSNLNRINWSRLKPQDIELYRLETTRTLENSDIPGATDIKIMKSAQTEA